MISGSRGTDDPVMATLFFIASNEARQLAHDVVHWLWIEAVTAAQEGVTEHVTRVNLPALKDLPAAVQLTGVPIRICDAAGAGVPVAGTAIFADPAGIAAANQRLRASLR